MQEKFENAVGYRQKVLKRGKKVLESEKLTLWSYKADLDTLGRKMKKIQSSIGNLEEMHNSTEKALKEAGHELEFTLELINLEQLTETIKNCAPWKIVQDVLCGICKVIGYGNGSFCCFLV
jgi:hypothetical protein